MDTYSLLREFADSWMMLAIFVCFLGIVAFTFRPGSRAIHDDIARIPLRNDTLTDEADDRVQPGADKAEARGEAG